MNSIWLENTSSIPKLATGIPGFEVISHGGLPMYRTTLVSGTAGAGKTILACQYLVEGIKRGENGVFVTFEDNPSELRENMRGFWDIEEMEKDGTWAFVDASPEPGEQPSIVGSYDLGGLMARIESAIRRVGAKRVALDSLGALFMNYPDLATLRTEMFRITSALKQLKTTAILTTERKYDVGDVSRFGVEEFVVDNVIILRNSLVEEKRHRTMEILKFRGAYHQKGEFPFSIDPTRAMIVIPLSAIELKQKSSNVRVSSGNELIDEMCGGGFFRDSIVLVSGATGTGKTLMVTQFLGAAEKTDEKAILFAFEESRDQLIRNATSWGVDFEQMEKDGRLLVVPEYPHAYGLEDHLLRMRHAIEAFKPDRVAVDSLSALERISTIGGFREFVTGLTSYIKLHEIAGLFTASTPTLQGGTSITESHISTITDSIILLRYVELYGDIRRGMTVLKMRGSMHEKQIREFTIDGKGMHVGKPFRNVTGIIAGHLTSVSDDELNRISALFSEESLDGR